MGFLKMLGLVKAEDYAKVERDRDALNDKLAAKINELKAADATLQKFRDQVRDTCARAEKAEALASDLTRQRDEAVDKYTDLASKYDAVVEENIALRPDAEAMRAKRRRGAEQKVAKRKSAAKPVSKFTKPIPEPKPVSAKVKKGAR